MQLTSISQQKHFDMFIHYAKAWNASQTKLSNSLQAVTVSSLLKKNYPIFILFYFTDAVTAALLGNVYKESRFLLKPENLDYSNTSNERIRKIFGSRVNMLTDQQLSQLKRDPRIFAELVYGPQTKMGKSLGNIHKDDAFNFRGRGFIQLTGRDNYAKYSEMIGMDLVKDPDLLSTAEVAVTVAFVYVAQRVCELTMKKHDGIPILYIETVEYAYEIVTQAIAGSNLDLTKGIGKEQFDKVKTFANQVLEVL